MDTASQLPDVAAAIAHYRWPEPHRTPLPGLRHNGRVTRVLPLLILLLAGLASTAVPAHAQEADSPYTPATGNADIDRHLADLNEYAARYPAAFARWFVQRGGELCCGALILGLLRRRHGVEAHFVDGEGRQRCARAEHLVLAVPPGETLRLLADPTADETRLLAALPMQRARIVVHRDRRLDGDDRASWGAFQIMGFHWQRLGYASVQDFVAEMEAGENQQFEAFARFIETDPALLKALQGKRWATFAKLYNGPAYARNLYDVKLERAYQRHADAAIERAA